MDKVLFQKDLFVGVPELDALVEFLSVYNQAFMRGIISNFGIVKNDSDVPFNNMKVVAGTLGNTISIKAGKAIDSNFKLIDILSDILDSYTIPSDSVDRYVLISSSTSNQAKGTVSISATGQLTGTGTEFLKLFRVGDYPTVIKFVGSANTLNYEIASVTDDFTAQLTGTNFTAESGKTFIVLGTFSQGQVIASPELYRFDKYTIAFSTTNTAVAQSVFCLAKINYTGSVRTITDMRSDFLKLNIKAVYNFLEATNNLSDIANFVTARSNLDVYSTSQAVAKTDIVDNLTTSSTTQPLSAKQGVAIKTITDALGSSKLNVSDVVNNLTTATTNQALSANQGVVIKAITDGLVSNKVNNSDIIDNLTTSISTKPLSANQGVAIKTILDALTLGLTNILSTVLTGISFSSATAITASDNILSAFGKLQKQVSNILAYTSDNISEGVTNLYFLGSRVLATVLTGLSTATNSAVLYTDTILISIGKLQAQITALASSKLDGTLAAINSVLVGDNNSHTHTYAHITSKPTTISGFGITDAVNVSDIVNNTSSIATDKPLAAAIGKQLSDNIVLLNSLKYNYTDIVIEANDVRIDSTKNWYYSCIYDTRLGYRIVSVRHAGAYASMPAGSLPSNFCPINFSPVVTRCQVPTQPSQDVIINTNGSLSSSASPGDGVYFCVTFLRIG